MRFFNLTNGLEALTKNDMHGFSNFPHFIRIQSTWCEQKLWKEIILDLDYTFLMACRIVDKVCVVDYSARKEVPRALYQGLAWIQYVLNRYWYGINDEPVLVRGHNCKKYFEEQYELLSYDKSARLMWKKLKYFKKFDGTGKVLLLSIAAPTEHDGDYAYYNSILKRMKKKKRF